MTQCGQNRPHLIEITVKSFSECCGPLRHYINIDHLYRVGTH
jgi:hypothetical protein